jgi:hypothetical protein
VVERAKVVVIGKPRCGDTEFLVGALQRRQAVGGAGALENILRNRIARDDVAGGLCPIEIVLVELAEIPVQMT